MADRALAIARQAIVIAGAGVTSLVAGVADYRIHVVGLVLTSDAVTQITMQDDSTSLMDIHLVAGGVCVMPDSTAGWLRCVSGDSLSLSSSGGNLGGVVLYRMVPDHVDL